MYVFVSRRGSKRRTAVSRQRRHGGDVGQSGVKGASFDFCLGFRLLSALRESRSCPALGMSLDAPHCRLVQQPVPKRAEHNTALLLYTTSQQPEQSLLHFSAVTPVKRQLCICELKLHLWSVSILVIRVMSTRSANTS